MSKIIKPLGMGAFGKVFLVKDKESSGDKYWAFK